MGVPRLYRTEAIVLKRSDFGEADKIATLYTPHMGKVRAVAKGVRRPTSRLGGHVELFIHGTMMLARGRNLDIITQSQTIDSFISLRDDLWRTSYGYYVAELLDHLTEENIENYPLYELLLATLKRIADERNPDIAVRFFEMQALGLLGYQPELRACVQCRRPLEAHGNFFSAPAGGVLCLDCGRPEPTAKALTLAAFKMLRLLQSGDWLTTSKVRVGETLRRELEAVFRGCFQFILERELKSTYFLNSLRDDENDSVRAAGLLRQRNADCIITPGGDGTNRAVARGSGEQRTRR